MVGNFTISRTNLVAEYHIQTLPVNYRAWARMLLEYSQVRYALVTDVILNHDMLRECYCSAYRSSIGNELAFTFRIANREIRVTELDLNRILRFPENDLVPYPTSERLTQFFISINYVNPNLQDSGERCKHHLPKQWNFFFHTLMQCFSYKKFNTHSISNFYQVLGFGVANNCRINFGKLLMNQLLYVLGPVEDRNLQVTNVECYFPRFLQLVLNDLTSNEEKLLYISSVTSCTVKQKNRIAGHLNNNRNYGNNAPAQMTEFMLGCVVDMERDVPLGRQEDDQVPEPVQEPVPVATPTMDLALEEEEEVVHQVTEEVQVSGDGDSVGHADSQKSYDPYSPTGSTQGSCHVSESSIYLDLQNLNGESDKNLSAEPSVAVDQGNESETQQILTPASKPNTTKTLPLSSLLPLKRKFVIGGDSASDAPHKEGEGTQTTLPLTRSRLEEPEVSVSPSMPSQKDIELKMANKQSLGTSSQQGEPIEICPLARTSELVSIIEPPTLIGVAQQGTHTEEELTDVATTVAELMQVDPVQVMPSQAIAGVTGPSLPHITGSNVISPPGGTFLAPNKEVSATIHVVERQLLGNSSSDEPCRILTAGTEDLLESKSVSETPTERMSDHNSPTPLRLSESTERNTPSESVSETPTSQINTHTVHTQSLSQRVSNLEATVTAMRIEFQSNVTEIKTVQYDMLQDLQGFKVEIEKFVTDLVDKFESQTD